MTRRGLFGAVAAAVVARLLGKGKPGAAAPLGQTGWYYRREMTVADDCGVIPVWLNQWDGPEVVIFAPTHREGDTTIYEPTVPGPFTVAPE